MNNLNQNNTKYAGAKPTAQGNQPFARALLESENTASSPTPNIEQEELNPFAQALSQTKGGFSHQLEELSFKDQAEKIAQEKKEALRKKLHDRVNPVETHEIFRAQAKENLEELEATRKELKMLAQDIKNLDKEIDTVLTQEVVDPGTSGTGFFNFFHKLREWIMLLRKQVHSAQTWMSQVSGKGKQGRGTAFSFKNSKNVHDAMGSEKNFGMNMGG
jgi:hypothetical protein